MNLIQGVDAIWNSKFFMVLSLFEQSRTDMRPLSSEAYETVAACLHTASPLLPGSNRTNQAEESLVVKSYPKDRNVKNILVWNKWAKTQILIGVSDAKQVWHFGEPNSTDPLKTAASKIQNHWILNSNTGTGSTKTTDRTILSR